MRDDAFLPVSFDIILGGGERVPVIGAPLPYGLAVHTNPGLVSSECEHTRHSWVVSCAETGAFIAGGATAAKATSAAMERIEQAAKRDGQPAEALVERARAAFRRRLDSIWTPGITPEGGRSQ